MVTQDNELVKSYVYKIEVSKRINGYSFADVQVSSAQENTSIISIIKPTETEKGGIQSSPPLGGKYIVNCPNPDNPSEIAKSRELDFNRWYGGLQWDLDQDFPWLSSRIWIRQAFPFEVVGR